MKTNSPGRFIHVIKSAGRAVYDAVSTVCTPICIPQYSNVAGVDLNVEFPEIVKITLQIRFRSGYF